MSGPGLAGCAGGRDHEELIVSREEQDLALLREFIWSLAKRCGPWCDAAPERLLCSLAREPTSGAVASGA